jgi:cyclophilin family peptidyl-prolyl cis-trans isomerase
MTRKTTAPRTLFACILTLTLVPAARATDVVMCTDLGPVTIQLFDEQAPLHVANFLDYMDRGYYTGTVFHRVIEDFVVQGGGHDRDLRGKPAGEPIENESRNGASNTRGTLAAARTGDPHSATSQFFFNLADNSRLDASGDGWGYTVFGRVTDGMDVVDAIAALPTGPRAQFEAEVTNPLIAITAMTRRGETPFPELRDDARLEAIRERIATTIDEEDLVAAATWMDRYHAECGEMTADLRVTEATIAMVTERKPAAITALDEYFRIASPRHASYEVAQSLYEMLVPEGAENIIAAPSAALAQLAGECLIGETPSLPDGANATLDDMVAGQQTVREFIASSNESLECLDDAGDDRSLNDDQRSLLTRAYNDTVDLMEEVADQFNEQIRIFRERQ